MSRSIYHRVAGDGPPNQLQRQNQIEANDSIKSAKIKDIMEKEYLEKMGFNDEEFQLREDFYALTFFKSVEYSRCLYKIRTTIGTL